MLEGDVLPDGDWFGFIEGLNDPPTLITFDLACYFDGDQAEPAAVADGHPVPLEFFPYIRNQNPKVFTIPVAGNARVDDLILGMMPFGGWPTSLPAADGCAPASGFFACAVWVQIAGGEAVLLHGFLPEWAGDDRGA